MCVSVCVFKRLRYAGGKERECTNEVVFICFHVVLG